MSGVAPATHGTSGRRCRARPRAHGELRPTDVVGAFFVAGVGFIVAGVIAAVVNAVDPWSWGRWLALHLVFVGGISQLVLGASQFFVGAFLATDPPPRALVRAQVACWNAGAVLLAVAVVRSWEPLVWLAVALLLAGLATYGLGLAAMRRRAMRSRPLPLAWYGSAAAFLALGTVAGGALAVGAAWPHGNLLGAHLALNLGGWFGAAIVGTLHTFYPSLTKTELPRPHLERWTYGLWVGGIGALAGGYGWALEAVTLTGWIVLALAALVLSVNVGGCLVAAPRPLSLPARLLGVAQVFLVAGLAVAAATAAADGAMHALAGSTRAAVGTLLVAGWVGLTVLGSLVHLLAVVIRVRDLTRPLPVPRPGRDIALTALAAAGVALVALAGSGAASDLSVPGGAALIAAYAILLARVLGLAVRVVARARPSI